MALNILLMKIGHSIIQGMEQGLGGRGLFSVDHKFIFYAEEIDCNLKFAATKNTNPMMWGKKMERRREKPNERFLAHLATRMLNQNAEENDKLEWWQKDASPVGTE